MPITATRQEREQETYVQKKLSKKINQMFTITINAKTPEEFKEAVRGLYALFPDAGKKTKPEPKAGAQPNPANAEVKPAESPASVANPGITLEIVRAEVQEKAAAKEENKAAIKTILASFGAPNVATLSPEHYADFLTKVKAIA